MKIRKASVLYGMLRSKLLLPQGEEKRRPIAKSVQEIPIDEPGIFHGPADIESSSNGSSTTTNWAGYVVSSNALNTFHNVVGSFIVPTMHQPDGTCGAGWYYSSSWVGLDGYAESEASLLQVGLHADEYINCPNATVTPNYYAWYCWCETTPNLVGETRIDSFPVTPGHEYYLRAYTTEEELFNITQGYIYIEDITQGASTYGNAYGPELVNAPPGIYLYGDSGEWIVERPLICNTETGACAGTYLANFYQDFFSGETVKINYPGGGGFPPYAQSNYTVTDIQMVTCPANDPFQPCYEIALSDLPPNQQRDIHPISHFKLGRA